MLAELVLAADRSYMLDGTWEDHDEPPPPATIRLTDANLGWFPMSNGLTRLHTRFWGRDEVHDAAARRRSARTSSPTKRSLPSSSPSRPTTSTGTTRSG